MRVQKKFPLAFLNMTKKIEVEPEISWDEKWELRGNKIGNDVYLRDYNYEGLENFLTEINLKKSLILFKFLLLDISKLEHWQMG